MGSVLSYSGLSTKIRAMQSRLVTDEQLEEIVQLPNVPQVTAYLKRTPEYQNIWSGLDENDLHRGQIEKLLKKSIFLNFSRLYHFANQEQRTFLSLYSRRYEIRVLKEIMTNLFDHRDTDPVDISPYCDFFRHHSKLDIDRLAALDLSYFSQIWNMRKKLFKGNDLKQITKAYGEKFDMLNLQFIQRSKRCFQMEPAAIYALLVPMNYKLRKEEITTLVEAPTPEEFRRIFNGTYYGKKYEQLTVASLEEFYNYILRSILEQEARKDPYSVAVIYSYLYHKEHEVNRLTIALECVRYGVDPEQSLRYIRNG